MKTVIEMAREAGFTSGELAFMQDNFLFFANLVRADEREACAMRAWSCVLAMTDAETADKVLAAIRARSNT